MNEYKNHKKVVRKETLKNLNLNFKHKCFGLLDSYEKIF